MANQVNQSTALVPYKEPKIPYANQGSTAYFIQSEVERGERMVAGRFKGLDVMGKESARLASQVASTIIFQDPKQARHPIGGIIGGYCEDLRFVEALEAGLGSRYIARFYTPNENRRAFKVAPQSDSGSWARLAFFHVRDLAKAQEAFSARLKSAEERESRGEVLLTRQPGSATLGLDNTAWYLSSADLRQNTDPDIQGKN